MKLIFVVEDVPFGGILVSSGVEGDMKPMGCFTRFSSAAKRMRKIMVDEREFREMLIEKATPDENAPQDEKAAPDENAPQDENAPPDENATPVWNAEPTKELKD